MAVAPDGDFYVGHAGIGSPEKAPDVIAKESRDSKNRKKARPNSARRLEAVIEALDRKTRRGWRSTSPRAKPTPRVATCIWTRATRSRRSTRPARKSSASAMQTKAKMRLQTRRGGGRRRADRHRLCGGRDEGADRVDVYPPRVEAAPAVDSVNVREVTAESALLQAQIDTDGSEASYRFEYGTAPCSSSPSACTPVPKAQESPASCSRASATRASKPGCGTAWKKCLCWRARRTTTGWSSPTRTARSRAPKARSRRCRNTPKASPTAACGKWSRRRTRTAPVWKSARRSTAWRADASPRPPKTARRSPTSPTGRSVKLKATAASNRRRCCRCADPRAGRNRRTSSRQTNTPKASYSARVRVSCLLVQSCARDRAAVQRGQPHAARRTAAVTANVRSRKGHQEKTLYVRADGPIQPQERAGGALRRSEGNGEAMGDAGYGYVALVTGANAPGAQFGSEPPEIGTAADSSRAPRPTSATSSSNRT